MTIEQKDIISKYYYYLSNLFLDENKPFKDRLASFIDFISHTFEIKRCSLMLIDYNDLSIEVYASTNPKIVGFKRKLSDVSISTMALIENEALWIDNDSRTYFQSLDKSKYESTSSLSIPIKYFDKKLGVVNLTDFQNINKFVDFDIELVKELVRFISPFISAEISNQTCMDYARKLENKNNDFIELDKMKSELINFIVHDLKSPISVVIANLDMLLYDNLTKDQIEIINLALEEMEKLQSMVLNILDVQKLEEARINILREDIDILNLVHQRIRSLSGILNRRKINIDIKGDPINIYIDNELIGRVINNIIINAIEHSPDESTIIISVKDDTNNVIITFEDMGGGIPEDMIDKIFNKYFQALEEGRAYSKTSTGLGLTFCKLVVEAHGGTIKAENTTKGALFTVTLPKFIKITT